MTVAQGTQHKTKSRIALVFRHRRHAVAAHDVSEKKLFKLV